MNRIIISFMLLTTAFGIGRITAPKPDSFIIAAYDLGRESVLVDVIEGEIIEVASK